MVTVIIVTAAVLIGMIEGALIHRWGYRTGYKVATARYDDVLKQFIMGEEEKYEL